MTLKNYIYLVMFIQTNLTPNPLTLKFSLGRVVISEGTAFYQNES